MAKQKSYGKVGVPAFQKTAVPCLYRYSSSGVYYALLKNEGKQIRASLRTANFTEAKRKLVDFRRDVGRVDQSKGQIHLQALVQKYLETLGGGAEKTIRRKTDIAARLIRDFPKGKNYPVNKITPSDLLTWLSKYRFGPSSRQLYVMFLKALFAMAVEDKILPASPAEKIKSPKRSKPIRQTPSFEDFRGIVKVVRSQKFSDTANESADFIEFLGFAGLGPTVSRSSLTPHGIATAALQMVNIAELFPQILLHFISPFHSRQRSAVATRIRLSGMRLPISFKHPPRAAED